jgi:signal peptidase I
MEMTILSGDYFIATPSSDDAKRKEIVVYNRRGQTYVHRVLGLPGDTIAMRNRVVVVNGDSIAEPYAQHFLEESRADAAFAWQRRFVPGFGLRRTYAPTLTDWGPIVIPPGQYFLLGDNRGQAADSRYDGFVDRRDIFARPRFIYFSKSRSTGEVRWRRIGQSIADSQ